MAACGCFVFLWMLLASYEAISASDDVPDGVYDYLPPPENVTFPNAINTSITIQWQYPTIDYCNTTTFNSSFEIKYWMVNKMDSAIFVDVFGTYIIDEDNNQTYVRHDIDGLEPRQYYTFQIRSFCGDFEEHDVISSNWTVPLTKGAIDGVPDRPVNLTAVEIDHHNIMLMWDEPMNPNGNITQYEINYKKHSPFEQSQHAMYLELRSTEPLVTIMNLEESTEYEFQVAAQTRLGVGLAAILPVSTKPNNGNMSVFLVVAISMMAFAMVGITSGLTYTAVRRKPSDDIRRKQEGIAGYGTTNTHQVKRTCNNSYSNLIHNISLDQLQLRDTLSVSKHTGYEVLRGEFKNKRHRNKITVAIKTSYAGGNTDVRERLHNEAETLELLRDHINIVQLIGTCMHQGTFYNVQEFVPNGTLHRFLRDSSRQLRTATETILDIAIGIATGLEFIANKQVIHRNISTESILISHNMAVKISGFGYAMRPGVPPINNPVSVLTNWRPKSVESLNYGIHTKESDVWSFGVVFWEITNPGKTPYNAYPYHKMKHLISEGYRLPRPKHWHSSMYELMMQCWLQEPTERPQFHNLTSALRAIRKKKQFYPNITIENNLTDSSLDLEDFDIIASSEPDDTDSHYV